jgi:hypothetical protein
VGVFFILALRTCIATVVLSLTFEDGRPSRVSKCVCCFSLITYLNSFTPRLQQTTSSAHIFSKSKVRMGKHLKKSCSIKPSGQCFFKYFHVFNFFVSFSRRHCQNSKMATLGLNLYIKYRAATRWPSTNQG